MQLTNTLGHPIDALIWDTREYINAGPHWIGIDGGTRWIYGLDTRLQIEWKPDRELGNVEYEYGDCEWSANDYFGSRKCGNCGRGLWTSGASPAQQKPGSNKGCDEQRRWRVRLYLVVFLLGCGLILLVDSGYGLLLPVLGV